VQIVGHEVGMCRTVRRVAPAESGAVVVAHAGEAGDFRLYETPRGVVTAEPFSSNTVTGPLPSNIRAALDCRCRCVHPASESACVAGRREPLKQRADYEQCDGDRGEVSQHSNDELHEWSTVVVANGTNIGRPNLA